MRTDLRCWVLLCLFTFLAMPPLVAAVGVPEPVKDISTATVDSSPSDFFYWGGTFYFAADDGVNGRELWKSDGTIGTAKMVMDINPGQGSSSPEGFVLFDGALHFWASSPGYSDVLWKTDGETAERLTDVSCIDPGGTCVSGGLLYFAYYDWGTHTRELWKWDGTRASKVKEVGYGIEDMVDANGTLFFRGDDGAGGMNIELWKSNGSESGTGMVEDLNPSGIGVWEIVALGDIVLLKGDTGGSPGKELYKSDGSSITLVKDIYLGPQSSDPRYFCAIGGKAYFQATTASKAGVTQLWVTDGTEGNTEPLGAGSPANMVEFGGKAYYMGVGGIWTTDGTLENTELAVADAYFNSPVVSGSKIFFIGRDDDHGDELWVTDGTPGETGLVDDLTPGPSPANTQFLELCGGGGLLAFSMSAGDTDRGKEPWISDGTAAGTDVLEDINAGSLGSEHFYTGSGVYEPPPGYFAEVNGVGYFGLKTNAGREDAYGMELWRSDGATDGTGTYMLKDVLPGPDSSDLKELIRAGDILFFTARNDLWHRELWMSDGTDTTLVNDFNPGGNDNITILGAVNGKVVFLANDGAAISVWASNGTTHEIIETETTGWSDDSAVLDGILVCGAWATDGSASGTQELPITSGYPFNLTRVGDKVFFMIGHGSKETNQLGVTNGTPGGTDQLTFWVESTTPGVDHLAGIADVDGEAFFVADDFDHLSPGENLQLWKSNGSIGGTGPVTTDLAGLSGRLGDGIGYKGKYYASNGTALLRSDGTDGNTALVNDNVTFKGTLTLLGDYLYFIGSDAAGGVEVWRTDGTDYGAEIAMDIMPGAGSSDPLLLGKLVETTVGKGLADVETLLFLAEDPDYGMELWKVTEYVADDSDTTPPVITLNGLAVMNLERDLDIYTEPGATATDNVDPSVSVTIGGDTVDTSIADTYYVTYDAVDAAGNPAVQVTRTVIVGDPLGLCDVLENSAALLGLFRNDFETPILAVCDTGLEDLACADPEYDYVYTDVYALSLAYGGACPGTDADQAASTHAAFAQNQVELAELAAANPGHNLRRNVDILAALFLLSGTRRDGILSVFEDGAGMDLTGFVPVVVSCSGPGTKGSCYPDVSKSGSKEEWVEIYSAQGDLDGDGITNFDELKNVLDAGGTAEDFAQAASDPESDGTDIGPGALCVLSEDFDLLLDAFVQAYGVATDDLDGDGVPEGFVLQLVRNIACFETTSSLREATLNAYDINLAFLELEAEAAAVADHKDILAVLLFLSEDTKAAVLGILDGNGITLTSDYVVVTCDAGLCLPAVTKDVMMVFDKTSEGAKALNEPYSGSCDLDGDGVTGLQEYQNVMANGGTKEFFAMVAAEALCDGTETQAERCDLSGNDGANAIDVQLVINAALSLPVDVIFIDVDFSDAVNAVDVQLVINAALGLLTK